MKKGDSAVFFGAVLFLVGIAFCFYQVDVQAMGFSLGFFPYQTQGLILLWIGIVFFGLGFLLEWRNVSKIRSPKCLKTMSTDRLG